GGDETDVESQEARIGRPRRIDVPDEPVGIAQAIRPDLAARALDTGERVVVRHTISAVLADSTGLGVRVEVGDDAEDFAGEGVEPLWREPEDALAAIASARVSDAE